jgi:hypothetical protein
MDLRPLNPTVITDALVLVDDVQPLPPLSVDEDSFALAVIECSGNVAAAHRMVYGDSYTSPGARGRMLLQKPQIAARIEELTGAIKETTFISIGTHLQELAVIRDLAKAQGQIKVALTAERARGEVVGLYNRFEHGDKTAGPVLVQINLVSKYDADI